MQIILNSRVKRNLRQKDRHVRQVHQVQAKALQCHRRPLRQRGRLPLHRQTVWQEAVRHQAAVLQEVPVTDHQVALHQEAVQHPGTTTTEENGTLHYKFEPDEVYSGEESISATYSVSSTKEITYGKVTINYDTNAMKYDDSNAEDSDALEGMTIKVIKPTDSAGTEGKIVIEFFINNTEKAERNSGRSLVQSDRQCNNRSAVQYQHDRR